MEKTGKKTLWFTENKYVKSKNERLNQFPSKPVILNLFTITLF